MNPTVRKIFGQQKTSKRSDTKTILFAPKISPQSLRTKLSADKQFRTIS